MMTISERVLAYLKERPGTLDEIGKALNLTRTYSGYKWGKWSFSRAERKGLIAWKGGNWHLVKEFKEAEA